MSRADAKQISSRSSAAGIEDDAAGAAARFAERAEREDLAEVAYATFDSPLGIGLVAATERGVVAVGAAQPGASTTSSNELAAEISPRILELPGRLDEARRELDQYFEGTPARVRPRRSTGGWSAAASTAGSCARPRRLPFGVTSTYGEIAARAGNPRAYRAAGTALGHNPIPIVVPCHRVLRAGGLIGDYGGGPEMKEFLLRLEGAIVSTSLSTCQVDSQPRLSTMHVDPNSPSARAHQAPAGGARAARAR